MIPHGLTSPNLIPIRDSADDTEVLLVQALEIGRRCRILSIKHRAGDHLATKHFEEINETLVVAAFGNSKMQGEIRLYGGAPSFDAIVYFVVALDDCLFL